MTGNVQNNRIQLSLKTTFLVTLIAGLVFSAYASVSAYRNRWSKAETKSKGTFYFSVGVLFSFLLDGSGHAAASSGHRPTTITYPSSRVITYNYTGNNANYLNRISSVQTNAFSGGGTVKSSYEYLGLSTVVEVDHEEPDVRLDLIGSSHSYSGFDRFGRVVDQKWYDYGSSSDVDRYKYGYDRASNRLYRENTKTSNKDEYYSYDDVYRLEIADRGNLNTGIEQHLFCKS